MWCDGLQPPAARRDDRRRGAWPAQSESEQRPHKLSYRVGVTGARAEAVVKQLEERLSAAGVRAKVRRSCAQGSMPWAGMKAQGISG